MATGTTPPPVQDGPVTFQTVWMVALAADCPREPHVPRLCSIGRWLCKGTEEVSPASLQAVASLAVPKPCR